MRIRWSALVRHSATISFSQQKIRHLSLGPSGPPHCGICGGWVLRLVPEVGRRLRSSSAAFTCLVSPRTKQDSTEWQLVWCRRRAGLEQVASSAAFDWWLSISRATANGTFVRLKDWDRGARRLFVVFWRRS